MQEWAAVSSRRAPWLPGRGATEGAALQGCVGTAAWASLLIQLSAGGLRSAVQMKARQDPCRVIALVFSVAKKLQTSIEYRKLLQKLI